MEQSLSIGFLGVTIDDNLQWSPYVPQLCSRLSRVCFALQSLGRFIDNDGITTVYHRCFPSLLSYGIEVWGGPHHAEQAFFVQKRAVRIKCRKPNFQAYQGLFRYLGVLTRALERVLVLVRKHLGEIWKVGSSHDYPTRHGPLLPPHRISCAFTGLG